MPEDGEITIIISQIFAKIAEEANKTGYSPKGAYLLKYNSMTEKFHIL